MGKPKTCNPCCGGGTGSSSSSSRFTGSTVPCITNCIGSVAPAQWTFTVAGVSAGSCPSGFCTAANRTWIVSPNGACSWRENTTPATSCGAFFTTLFAVLNIGAGFAPGFSASINVFFSNAASVMAQYQKNVTFPIDCLTSHELPYYAGSPPGVGRCLTWPSSIIVSPV